MKKIIETDKVFVLGDHVDTDLIIPARYLVTSDPKALGEHCLEDLLAGLAGRSEGNGVIVAGWNFGSGSSREHAPLALLGAGINCVIAASFARIFFRNAFNVGLPLLSCPESLGKIDEGAQLRLDIAAGSVEDRNKSMVYRAEAIDSFMIELLEAGGLVNHIAARLSRKGVE